MNLYLYIYKNVNAHEKVNTQSNTQVQHTGKIDAQKGDVTAHWKNTNDSDNLFIESNGNVNQNSAVLHIWQRLTVKTSFESLVFIVF